MPTTQTPTDIQGYFALVHPDDREALLAVYTAIAEHHAPLIEFQHRIIARDREVKYIKGMGERHESADGAVNSVPKPLPGHWKRLPFMACASAIHRPRSPRRFSTMRQSIAK